MLVQAVLVGLARRGRREQADPPGRSRGVGMAAASFPSRSRPGWSWRSWRWSATPASRRSAFARCASATVARVREAVWLAAAAARGDRDSGARSRPAPPTSTTCTKWAYVNYFGASTGYYQVARKQAVADPWKFLAEYPVWIQRQDSLHIGTHPPGLIALQCLLIRTMEQNPDCRRLPASVHALVDGRRASGSSRRWTGDRSLAPIARRSTWRA